jgi:hypothetical protein
MLPIYPLLKLLFDSEDNDLLRIQEMSKIVKIAKEFATAVNADNGKQYTFRVHGICNMISSWSPKNVSIDSTQDSCC